MGSGDAWVSEALAAEVSLEAAALLNKDDCDSPVLLRLDGNLDSGDC
jgi:hypothetical protein